MASVAPSPALLNARLTSEKLALEEKLREVTKANREGTKRYRDLEQRSAAQADRIAELEETQRELREHLARLLAAGASRPTIAPGQGRLFEDASADAVTAAIEDLASPAAEEAELVELEGDDVLVPDSEEPESRAARGPGATASGASSTSPTCCGRSAAPSSPPMRGAAPRLASSWSRRASR